LSLSTQIRSSTDDTSRLQLVFNLSPIKTALYFVPMSEHFSHPPQVVDADSESTVISGIVLNLVPGFLLARIDGKVLMVASMAMSLAGPILLAVIDIHAPYWYVPSQLPSRTPN
jgi:hypothetical protein